MEAILDIFRDLLDGHVGLAPQGPEVFRKVPILARGRSAILQESRPSPPPGARPGSGSGRIRPLPVRSIPGLSPAERQKGRKGAPCRPRTSAPGNRVPPHFSWTCSSSPSARPGPADPHFLQVRSSATSSGKRNPSREQDWVSLTTIPWVRRLVKGSGKSTRPKSRSTRV